MDEMLMQETLPEVEAETEIETAETEVEATEDSVGETNPAPETEAETEATAETGTETESTAEVEEAVTPVVKVKFNKQEREYSIDEATPLVQKGLKWDSFQETHEKLKFLSTTSGLSVQDLVDKLVESNEETLYQQILDKAGNEEIAKELHEAKKAERQRKFDEFKTQEAEREKLEAESETETERNRLANEFIELKKETGIAEFKDVPKSVLSLASKKHISLYDAYLRYERAETAKAKVVADKQAEASKASSGSLNSESQTQSTEYDDVTKAVFGY